MQHPLLPEASSITGSRGEMIFSLLLFSDLDIFMAFKLKYGRHRNFPIRANTAHQIFEP
jgi:hypothetical protein